MILLDIQGEISTLTTLLLVLIAVGVMIRIIITLYGMQQGAFDEGKKKIQRLIWVFIFSVCLGDIKTFVEEISSGKDSASGLLNGVLTFARASLLPTVLVLDIAITAVTFSMKLIECHQAEEADRPGLKKEAKWILIIGILVLCVPNLIMIIGKYFGYFQV